MIDATNINRAIATLKTGDPTTQLRRLQNLCTEYGTWGIPDHRDRHRPALYEIQLFGVAAMADEIGALPRNWMLAAQNTLAAPITP